MVHTKAIPVHHTKFTVRVSLKVPGAVQIAVVKKPRNNLAQESSGRRTQWHAVPVRR